MRRLFWSKRLAILATIIGCCRPKGNDARTASDLCGCKSARQAIEAKSCVLLNSTAYHRLHHFGSLMLRPALSFRVDGNLLIPTDLLVVVSNCWCRRRVWQEPLKMLRRTTRQIETSHRRGNSLDSHAIDDDDERATREGRQLYLPSSSLSLCTI